MHCLPWVYLAQWHAILCFANKCLFLYLRFSRGFRRFRELEVMALSVVALVIVSYDGDRNLSKDFSQRSLDPVLGFLLQLVQCMKPLAAWN